jgi:hypothetical protein
VRLISVLRRSKYIAVIAALCLVPAFLNSATNAVKTVTHYKVSSNGWTVGEITATQRMTEEGGVSSVLFETKTAVKASFLWMGYRLDTIEKGTLQKSGLVIYSRKGRENDAMIDVEGRAEPSGFRFDVREPGGFRSILIPRNSYDFTTMECPEARLDFSDRTRILLNILDVGKMEVVKREYHLVRNGHYSVAGKEYPCRVIDYSDHNKKARRWINYVGSAVVMYRQDGTGESNSYSAQIVSVNKEI